jgi:hypothetical protein
MVRRANFLARKKAHARTAIGLPIAATLPRPNRSTVEPATKVESSVLSGRRRCGRRKASLTLPFVGDTAGDTPAITIEAGVRRGAARDIDLVGNVGDIDRKPPVLPFVVNGGVAEYAGGNQHRVGGPT